MRSLCLCGLGPGWSLCPPISDDKMIWGLNNVLLKREVNYVFEIHNFYEKFNRTKGGHIHQVACRKASETSTPYIVRNYWGFLPHLKQVVYPWKDVFNHFKTDAIGCTFDAMLALAMYCGWRKIDVYGFSSNYASVYDYQIPTNSLWVGIALGAGVDIKFHGIGGVRHTDLLRTADGMVYGLGEPQTMKEIIDVTLPACDCAKRNEAWCTLF